MGPDGLPAILLKKCSMELTAAWRPIFKKSIDNHTVPNLWKKSIIIPVPKVSCPSLNKDFRPIALTCGVMKCFERVIVDILKNEVASCLDPSQFAYRAARSTEDAVVSVVHLISKHLQEPKAYARVLMRILAQRVRGACDRTAPMPVSEASTSTMNCRAGSGWSRTGAVVNRSLSTAKAVLAVDVQT